MKIGFTQCSTVSGDDNRMEQIKKKFKDDNDKDVAVIFVLMKSAVDVSSHHDFEDRLRSNVGMSVKKDYVKSLELPVPTEWVLTTQDYIDKLKKYIKEQRGDKGSIDARILNLVPRSFEKFKLPSLDDKEHLLFKDIIKNICE